MILVKDKWDEYVIDNERGDEWAALDLLAKRVEDNFWYYGDTADEAKEIIGARDASAALKFLLARKDHEYEYIEVTAPRNLSFREQT